MPRLYLLRQNSPSSFDDSFSLLPNGVILWQHRHHPRLRWTFDFLLFFDLDIRFIITFGSIYTRLLSLSRCPPGRTLPQDHLFSPSPPSRSSLLRDLSRYRLLSSRHGASQANSLKSCFELCLFKSSLWTVFCIYVYRAVGWLSPFDVECVHNTPFSRNRCRFQAGTVFRIIVR